MNDKIIALEGAINFRDFGGVTTRDGRTVRRHCLFRSGALANLTPQAQQQFQRLDIGVICDVRREEEKSAQPTPFPYDRPRRLEIPIEPGSAERLHAGKRHGKHAPDHFTAIMMTIYRELALEHSDDYARMFAGLHDAGDQGFLLHCSAGKDRTGLGCALILHMLGVPKDTVIKDYLFTNRALDRNYIAQLMSQSGLYPSPDPDYLNAITSVRLDYLEAAYQAIEENYDTIENYLEHAIGLNTTTQQLLRSRLLEL